MNKDTVEFNCPVCQNKIIVSSKQKGTGNSYTVEAVPISLALEFIGHVAYCPGCKKTLIYSINEESKVKMRIDEEA